MKQTVFADGDNSIEAARRFDSMDKLAYLREEFEFPKGKDGKKSIYFVGHSLGLLPKRTRAVMKAECESWGQYGVDGHTHAKYPWVPYHSFVADSLARLVGARSSEVVAMNTLTINLHMMMVSFYRPTKKRYKIIIEKNAFPSDQYAVDSQAQFHGFDPKDAIVELQPEPGQMVISEESVLEQIRAVGDEAALIMLGNPNYLSGQCFDMEAITRLGHEIGAYVGFNLAHGVGNMLLNLHETGVDFAVWCSYKYLNSGPGGIAAAFVHERHHGKDDMPRFEGWWGTREQSRFKMARTIDRIPTAEVWAVSNPPIFQLAALRASMELFDEATMPRLREKGDKLTSYLEWLIHQNAGDQVDIITPSYSAKKQSRGSMLSLRFRKEPKALLAAFADERIFVDFREPDIIRVAPMPLYSSFEDVFRFIEIVGKFVHSRFI